MTFINEGIHQRAEVLADSPGDSIVYFPKLDGNNVTPSSAKVTVFAPSGGVMVPEAVVVPGANGRLTLSQAWPLATYYLAEDYAALFTYVSGGVMYSERVFFDVVKTKLLCQVSHTDLLETYPDLEEHLSSLNETDTSKWIRKAWSEILDRIRAAGNRPSLILDARRLTNPCIELALSYVSQALEKEAGDIWNDRKKDHRSNYSTLYNGLGQFKYDINEDALADKDEEKRLNRILFHV